jgi:hypothetical protein
VEESLTKAGFPQPTQVSKYADVMRLHTLYAEVETQPAWKDYMARVQHLRASITSELLLGTLDKFGNSRDSEKRAVLDSINRLLAFPPAIHRQYEDLTKRKEQQEEKAAKRSGIHSGDMLQTETYETPGLTARNQ